MTECRVLYRDVSIVVVENATGTMLYAAVKRALGHDFFYLESGLERVQLDKKYENDITLDLHPQAEVFTDSVIASCARTLPTIKVWSGDHVIFETNNLPYDATFADLAQLMKLKEQRLFHRGNLRVWPTSRVYTMEDEKIELI